MVAVCLQNWVCLLLRTDDHLRQLKILKLKATPKGGKAAFILTSSLDRAQEVLLTASFKANREDRHRELLGRRDAFEVEIV